jgi:Pyruvate/2-oxoacid:ferredoxin oxidoreductase delta subunit/flavodoxin
MIGLYFSGTGNTKHCVERFVKLYDNKGGSVSIESPDALSLAAAHDMIVLGYPVYYSNTPKIMRDFLIENGAGFAQKQVFIIATMGLWSGDGAGCAARLLRKQGAAVMGGLHLKMPDCIGDVKLLKKTPEANRRIISAAEEKIASAVKRLKAGVPPKNGLGSLYQAAGLLGQRLWFYGQTAEYKKKPDVDKDKCTGCGVCVKLCPMKNLAVKDGKAVSSGRCTLCYRCFSHCPQKALTILGKHVYEQCLFERINI